MSDNKRYLAAAAFRAIGVDDADAELLFPSFPFLKEGTIFNHYNIQRREERELIVIPHAIYEDRRALYQERIDAMLEYMNTDNQCRSRQLLRYFGETDSEDCGHCDVCTS